MREKFICMIKFFRLAANKKGSLSCLLIIIDKLVYFKILNLPKIGIGLVLP